MDPLGTQSQTGKTNTCNNTCAMHEIQTRFHFIHLPTTYSTIYLLIRGTSILGEVRNVSISKATQQLLCSKSHDFLAVFALAHSKINQIA